MKGLGSPGAECRGEAGGWGAHTVGGHRGTARWKNLETCIWLNLAVSQHLLLITAKPLCAFRGADLIFRRQTVFQRLFGFQFFSRYWNHCSASQKGQFYNRCAEEGSVFYRPWQPMSEELGMNPSPSGGCSGGNVGCPRQSEDHRVRPQETPWRPRSHSPLETSRPFSAPGSVCNLAGT